MARDGVVCTTFGRQSRSRNRSSLEPALRISASRPFERIGERDHRLRAGVGDDEGNARFDPLLDLRNQLLGLAAVDDLEREFLLQEPTGGVVVVDGEPCSGNAIVRRRHIEKRERRGKFAQLAGEHDRDPVQLARMGRMRVSAGRRLLARDDRREGQAARQPPLKAETTAGYAQRTRDVGAHWQPSVDSE